MVTQFVTELVEYYLMPRMCHVYFAQCCYLHKMLMHPISSPTITVSARHKGCTVLYSSRTGIVDSNLTQANDIRIVCVCLVMCSYSTFTGEEPTSPPRSPCRKGC